MITLMVKNSVKCQLAAPKWSKEVDKNFSKWKRSVIKVSYSKMAVLHNHFPNTKLSWIGTFTKPVNCG